MICKNKKNKKYLPAENTWRVRRRGKITASVTLTSIV
jgi:hypothetical protein